MIGDFAALVVSSPVPRGEPPRRRYSRPGSYGQKNDNDDLGEIAVVRPARGPSSIESAESNSAYVSAEIFRCHPQGPRWEAVSDVCAAPPADRREFLSKVIWGLELASRQRTRRDTSSAIPKDHDAHFQGAGRAQVLFCTLWATTGILFARFVGGEVCCTSRSSTVLFSVCTGVWRRSLF